MLFNEAGRCILGSKLLGISKNNRPNIKTGIIILKRYNDYCLVLVNNCSCKILQVSNLPDWEYKKCMEKLRERDCKPSDEITDELEGRRIFCEFNGKPKEVRGSGRKQVVMKSKIAVAYISHKENKSGTYIASDKFILKQ